MVMALMMILATVIIIIMKKQYTVLCTSFAFMKRVNCFLTRFDQTDELSFISVRHSATKMGPIVFPSGHRLRK